MEHSSSGSGTSGAASEGTHSLKAMHRPDRLILVRFEQAKIPVSA